MDAKAETGFARGAPAPWRAETCGIRLRDGTALLIRPTGPDDLPRLARNFAKLTVEDVHQRFFEYLSDFPERLARQVTRPQPRCDLALLAVPPPEHGPSDDVYGMVQLVCIGDTADAEYAIMVRHDWQGRGLGWALTEVAIGEARHRGLAHIHAYVLPDNARMLRMLREFGFSIRADPRDARVMLAELDLARV